MARELPWFFVDIQKPYNKHRVQAKNKMDAIKRTCEDRGCKSYEIISVKKIRNKLCGY